MLDLAAACDYYPRKFGDLVGRFRREGFDGEREADRELNRALSFELTAVIQYMQHSFLVTGAEREVYRSYFRDQSEESHDHAEMLGDKIVSLGGVPTVEPSMIRQSTDLPEMLRQDLEMERESLQAYMYAWNACGDGELSTRFLLEGRIADEQLHVEEL